MVNFFPCESLLVTVHSADTSISGAWMDERKVIGLLSIHAVATIPDLNEMQIRLVYGIKYISLGKTK